MFTNMPFKVMTFKSTRAFAKVQTGKLTFKKEKNNLQSFVARFTHTAIVKFYLCVFKKLTNTLLGRTKSNETYCRDIS